MKLKKMIKNMGRMVKKFDERHVKHSITKIPKDFSSDFTVSRANFVFSCIGLRNCNCAFLQWSTVCPVYSNFSGVS